MISEQACSTEMHRLAVTQTKNTNASMHVLTTRPLLIRSMYKHRALQAVSG